MGKLVDLTGKVFGQWTVLDKTKKRSPNGAVYWRCKCTCGKIVSVKSDSLTGGISKACFQCGQINSRKRFCLNGHDTDIWKRNNQGKCYACQRDRHLQKTYGITLEEFIALYKFQNGKCCICGKEFVAYTSNKFNKEPGKVRMELDHDHKIKDKHGSVRGILCGGRFAGCNRKLGKIDNSNWLANAAKYITSPPAQRFFQTQEGSNAKKEN